MSGRLVHITLGGNPELGGSVTRPPTLLSHLCKWCWRMAHWMQLLSIACALCSLQLNKLWQVTRHDVPLTC